VIAGGRGRGMTLGLAAAVALAASAWLGPAAPIATAQAGAPVTFSGPLGSTGSKLHAPAETSQFDLAPYGYREDEYLASGTAEGNTAGYKQSQAYPAAPFTTRIIVRRPTDPKRANGTVLFEWMNVSLQQDTDVDWIEGYRELLHDGFTYVAVSVQPSGVPLQQEDPVRYAQIHIPPYGPNADTGASPDQGGPSYGESIFSQLAHALKSPAGASVLGGAPAQRIVAVGESQSAGRLSCYLLDAKPVDSVFDGFLIDHGECAGPTVKAGDPFPYAPSVPTMFLDGMFESRPGMHDDSHLRVWQIAGASHVDAWIGAYGKAEHNWDETGTPQGYDQGAAGRWGLEGGQGGVCNLFTAGDPVRADELPQQYTHDSALAALQTWITTGRPPVATPPLKFDANGTAAKDGAGGGVAVDQYGNPLGGLRLPQIDVPVAQYQGTCPQQGQMLIGTTVPFTDAQVQKLYPTFADYRTKMCAASLAEIDHGTLLAFDAQDIDRRVKLARGRWPASASGDGASDAACAPVYALPAGGTCRDRHAPHAAIARRGARVRQRRLRVRGTARDSGCRGGAGIASARGRVRRVLVSVALVRHHRCRFLTRTGRLARLRRCSSHPVLLRASGTRRWRFVTRRALPRGTYRVVALAVDAAGNREKRANRRNTIRLRVR
jgi:hypothetical protein